MDQKKKTYQRLKLQLDADMARLSHILSLKEAFRAHSGAIPIEIAFIGKKGKIATLHIDQGWGVDYHKELEGKVSALPSLKALSWE